MKITFYSFGDGSGIHQPRSKYDYREGRIFASCAPPSPDPLPAPKRFAPWLETFRLAASPAFKRGKIAQTLLDIGALCFALFFLAVAGVGIAAAIFILFFVSL